MCAFNISVSLFLLKGSPPKARPAQLTACYTDNNGYLGTCPLRPLVQSQIHLYRDSSKTSTYKTTCNSKFYFIQTQLVTSTLCTSMLQRFCKTLYELYLNCIGNKNCTQSLFKDISRCCKEALQPSKALWRHGMCCIVRQACS